MPLKPWDKTRIDSEKKLAQDYGLRRKSEIWKMQSVLRNYRRIARGLAANTDKEREKILLDKLFKIGLVGSDANLDDVLALTIEKLLDRRLQTIVFKKGISNTIKQSRQMIVHGHIAVDGRKTKWPSAIIPLADEGKISVYMGSKMNGGKQ